MENEKTRAVIISLPRSGTEFLVECLNSHPDIFSHSEIMKHYSRHDLLANMRKYYREGAVEERGKVKVLCHKLFYYHMDPFGWHEIKRQARDGSLKVIHMVREDHKMRVLSWHFKDRAHTLPVDVSPDWFEYKVRQSVDMVRFFRAELAQIPHVEVTLEEIGDMASRIPADKNKDICKFLGVRYRVLAGTPRSQTDYTSPKFMSNAGELFR